MQALGNDLARPVATTPVAKLTHPVRCNEQCGREFGKFVQVLRVAQGDRAQRRRSVRVHAVQFVPFGGEQLGEEPRLADHRSRDGMGRVAHQRGLQRRIDRVQVRSRAQYPAR